MEGANLSAQPAESPGTEQKPVVRNQWTKARPGRRRQPAEIEPRAIPLRICRAA